MDYNDIIVIMLLVIVIMGLGLILLKKEYSQFIQTEQPNSQLQNNLLANNYLPMNDYRMPINLEHLQNRGEINNNTNDNNFYNTHINKNRRNNAQTVTHKKMETLDNSNREIGINDKLASIKNSKNKNSVMLKNKNIKNNICIDDNKKNNSFHNNIDLQSLDNNSLISLNNFNGGGIKKNDIDDNKYNKKSKYKNNEEINRKVIIDDYSEFDNIKSLNSMDNTLSDLISIVEKDK